MNAKWQSTGKERELTNNVVAFAPRSDARRRYAIGESLRQKFREVRTPIGNLGTTVRPVQLIEKSDEGRFLQLVAGRGGCSNRRSPPIGGPRLTWRPISRSRATGVRVQACGDAHLGNFRGFATPERQINFDIHDLDETLPAPWEWDLKRLATSFVVACRDNGLDKASARMRR